MTSVERPNRNSLTAYGHLFEPRPSHVRRNTLRKKRASSDVSPVRLSAHDLDEVVELTASEVSALDLAGTPSLHHPNGSQSPFAAEEQTQHRYGDNVLPWGWMPTRVGESKLAATVTTTEVAVGGEPLASGRRGPSRHRESEPAKVPVQVQPYKQRTRLSRPVATYRSYDPNFLMPLPPAKQAQQRSRARRQPYRQPVGTPLRTMGERYVTMSNSNQYAVGPAYAQMRRPTRPPMAPSNQMDQRHSSYDNWPRPPSSSSSIRSNMSNASYGMMQSPNSSRSSFSSYDSSRPEYGAWQRPSPIKQTRRRRDPGELFAILPSEVLQLVLAELRNKHLSPSSDSCATCMMRDLCSVSLTCRRLSKPAQAILYGDIEVVGVDSAAHKKRFKGAAGTRLILLRRTLRDNAELASLVRTLKVPAIQADTAADKYQDKVASIIMACPNFERLLGFHQPYDHSFSRLFHALSTREHLKEMNWFLEAAPVVQRTKGTKLQPASGGAESSSMDLELGRSAAFFDLHMNWSRLTTLSMHCAADATLDGVSMFGMTLANMPSLQHLYLSNLPTTVFNDATLLSLPSLQTLSMSNLQGVSSAGLASFARRPSSHGIQRLTLRHLDIDSLPALGRLFSYLTVLKSFTLVQTEAPVLPADEVIWLYPYLASNSLQKLHWDVPTQGRGASEADRILAKSIASQGYPALRALRTPHDPDAVFQNLCAPLERIEMASDKYRGLIARIPDRIRAPEPSPPMTPITPTSPRGFGKSFPNTKYTNDPPTPIEAPVPEESHLAQSRLAAQSRIEAARNVPRFQVNVINEDGSLLDHYGLAGFIGQVESKIQYLVRPDYGATDENGGLVVVTDLLKDCGEELKDREGCTGRWLSWTDGMTADKKERERWWHTERGRWQELRIS